MRIVLREEIILSKKESEAFDLVEKVLEGLQREVKDIFLLRQVEDMLDSMYSIYEHITEVEEN